MSNTVSTEATLFSTTHPDVENVLVFLLLSYPLSFA